MSGNYAINKRKDAKRRLAEILTQPSNVVVIHYSCASFYNIPDGASPRITSIAARNLSSGQTQSFSIHQMAERRHYSHAQLEQYYDELECEMLKEFYAYAKEHERDRWMHWNMINSQYGFQALAHRYQVLGGDASHVDLKEDARFNLADVLRVIYGPSYAPHHRLEHLVQMNNLTSAEFLNGQGEADAFDNKEYVRLHYSTLRKVTIISELAELAHTGKLVTKATWKDKYGGYGEALGELLKDNWWIVLLVFLLSLLGNLASIVELFQ